MEINKKNQINEFYQYQYQQQEREVIVVSQTILPYLLRLNQKE